MIRFLADQNFSGIILRSLLKRNPNIDCVRTQDLSLEKLPDYQLLTWAAEENRIILTHDINTFPTFAYEKMAKGEKMSGVIIVSDQISIGQAIEDLETIIFCKFDNEWENSISYIPF